MSLFHTKTKNKVSFFNLLSSLVLSCLQYTDLNSAEYSHLHFACLICKEFKLPSKLFMGAE